MVMDSMDYHVSFPWEELRECSKALGIIRLANYFSQFGRSFERIRGPSLRELSKSPRKYEMKVEIKNWNGVATWRWLANDDTCGICRLAFDGCCPDCKIPGDECPIVWGQCTHCFHIHCIMKWLNSQQVNQQCPMCRQEWKFRD